MSYVFYDIESSGLHTRFDQILQFAAIRTNSEFEIVEEIDLRCRLCPSIIPAPMALKVTARSFAHINDPSHLSHYEMVRQIHATLARWRPAVFIGFNSIKFDEELLRSAFYQSLHLPIFLTTGTNCARGDALKLARAAACLAPDVIKVQADPTGKRVMSLQALAAANNLPAPHAHDAMSDTRTTLELCKIIHSGAPTLWSDFMRFAQKAAAKSFIEDQEVFGYFDANGWSRDVQILTRLGSCKKNANAFHCLNLLEDIESLKSLSVEEIIDRQKDYKTRPIVKVKFHTSPILCNIWEVPANDMAGFTEEEICERAELVRSDQDFSNRLLSAAIACEPDFGKSSHVEEQIYDGFPSDADVDICRQFHAQPWERKVALISQMADMRLKRIAQRLVYFHRPDLLSDEKVGAISAEIERRVCDATEDEKWLTIPQALDEIEQLRPDFTQQEVLNFEEMKASLKERLLKYQAIVKPRGYPRRGLPGR